MDNLSNLKTRLFPAQGALSTMGGVKLAGIIRSNPGAGRPKMRDLGSHALVYLLAGGGTFEDSLGHRQTVRAGNLLWLFPEVPHAYGPERGGRWDEIYLIFDGPLFGLWREQGIIAPERPVWWVEPVDFWFGRLEAVARGSTRTGWEDTFQQLSQLQKLVAEMLLASRDETDDRRWLAQACRSLEAPGPVSADLETVARRAGLSYESFRKKFAQRMGMPPAKYRQTRVIERACNLLLDRSLSHKEIADQLGFCDEFHFSKIFRKCMGFPPHAFRLKAGGG